MTRKVSRRRFFGSLTGAVGGLTAVGAPAIATPIHPSTLSLDGKVKWCHRQRGLLSFGPDRPDASDLLVRLARPRDGGDDAERMRRLLRPAAPITMVLTWQPDVDLLMPWQATEVVCGDGERFAVEPKSQRPG